MTFFKRSSHNADGKVAGARAGDREAHGVTTKRKPEARFPGWVLTWWVAAPRNDARVEIHGTVRPGQVTCGAC